MIYGLAFLFGCVLVSVYHSSKYLSSSNSTANKKNNFKFRQDSSVRRLLGVLLIIIVCLLVSGLVTWPLTTSSVPSWIWVIACGTAFVQLLTFSPIFIHWFRYVLSAWTVFRAKPMEQARRSIYAVDTSPVRSGSQSPVTSPGYSSPTVWPSSSPVIQRGKKDDESRSEADAEEGNEFAWTLIFLGAFQALGPLSNSMIINVC